MDTSSIHDDSPAAARRNSDRSTPPMERRSNFMRQSVPDLQAAESWKQPCGGNSRTTLYRDRIIGIFKDQILRAYYLLAVTLIIGWSCFGVWLATVLNEEWSGRFQQTDLRPITTLFVFGLVFRFNQCYNRWWLGRQAWGSIVANSMELTRMVNLWIVDDKLASAISRLIVCFSYACKAQLRGLSLSSPSECGTKLVQRGLLSQVELDHIKYNPAWEPNLILDMLRSYVAQAMIQEYEHGGVLLLPHSSNKIHEKLFSPMDKIIQELGKEHGKNVTIRSAGMPPSYDAIHHIFFWILFTVAPIIWASSMGWLSVVVCFALATMALVLTDLGTCLIDPFGTDVTDLPLNRFCETIEAQVVEIRRRHKNGDMKFLTDTSKPQECLVDWENHLTSLSVCKEGPDQTASSLHDINF